MKIQRIHEIVLEDLRNKKFPKSKIGKSIIFIGRRSVGKSSLLNTLFKTKLPTSKKSCTK